MLNNYVNFDFSIIKSYVSFHVSGQTGPFLAVLKISAILLKYSNVRAERQTLPEINVYAPLFGTLEYSPVGL